MPDGTEPTSVGASIARDSTVVEGNKWCDSLIEGTRKDTIVRPPGVND